MAFKKGHPYSENRRKEITWEVNENGCWNCTSHRISSNGYPVSRENGKMTRISRMHYKKYKGEITHGLHVLHACDNTLCINPDHLFLGTHQDNMTDKCKKNRQAKGEIIAIKLRGESSVSHKITEIEAKEIKYGLKGLLQSEIAKRFNISQPEVSKIKIGKTWSYI